MSASPLHNAASAAMQPSLEPLLFRAREQTHPRLTGHSTNDHSEALDDLFDLPGDTKPWPTPEMTIPLSKADPLFAGMGISEETNDGSTTPLMFDDGNGGGSLPPWLLSGRSSRTVIMMVGIGLLCLMGAGLLIQQIWSWQTAASANMSGPALGGELFDPISTGAFQLPAVAETMKVSEPNGAVLQLPIGTSVKVLKQARQNKKAALQYGRPDPFSPLVDPNPPKAEDLPPPVETPIAYVGIIKDTQNTRKPRHVAMLQIKGDSKGRTLIKEAGDSFEVNGIPVKLTAVYTDRITIVVDGRTETLLLKTYEQVANEVQMTRSGDQNQRSTPGTAGGRR